jgi:hypothetical protein
MTFNFRSHNRRPRVRRPESFAMDPAHAQALRDYAHAGRYSIGSCLEVAIAEFLAARVEAEPAAPSKAKPKA